MPVLLIWVSIEASCSGSLTLGDPWGSIKGISISTTGNHKAHWEATQLSLPIYCNICATKKEFIVTNKDVTWLTSIHLIFISWDKAGIAISMLEIPSFTFAYGKIMYLANWTYQLKNAFILFSVVPRNIMSGLWSRLLKHNNCIFLCRFYIWWIIKYHV